MLGKTAFQRVVIVTAIISGAALVIAALIWMGTGFAPADWRAADGGRAGDTVDQSASLSLSGVSIVTIDAASEDLRVVEGAGDAVEAWFHGAISPRSPQGVPRLVAEKDGAAATLRIEYPGPNVGILWSNLVLEVRVPPQYAGSVKATCTSGDIRVTDHAYAEFELQTTSGGMEVGALSATSATLRTTSGDIRAKTVSATEALLHSTSGGIRVETLTARNADISASSGDVRVSSLAVSGKASAQTTSGQLTVGCAAVPPEMTVTCTSGDVSIRLPATAAFALEAHAASGDVRCDFPITVAGGGSTHGEHDLTGIVGGSGGEGLPSIRVQTTSGGIRVKRE